LYFFQLCFMPAFKKNWKKNTMKPSNELVAFITGWKARQLHNEDLTLSETEPESDLFFQTIMKQVEGRQAEEVNKEIASQFGVITTQVKKFPTKDGTWIILDKHTKRLLHKDIKNENEVNILCKKHNYF